MTKVTTWLKGAVLEVQEYTLLVVAAIRATFSRPFYFRDVVEQFEAIGIGSLSVVLLTGFFTGAALALQSGMTLDQFGARSLVGRLVSASMSWPRTTRRPRSPSTSPIHVSVTHTSSSPSAFDRAFTGPPSRSTLGTSRIWINVDSTINVQVAARAQGP